MLVFQLLFRNWRSGELKLLTVSLVLAVAVLTGIAVFTDRLETTLIGQSNSFLGADTIVSSSKPLNTWWIEKAQQENIQLSSVVEFMSMVYAGDEMSLASIKAVEQNYPLRGNLEISQTPFAVEKKDINIAQAAPSQGEVWIDSRLIPQLNIHLGDQVTVGELSLTVTQILIREPDNSGFSPRVLMNLADVAATKVILPGSRITYSVLLASDASSVLENFMAWLKPQLSKHEQIINLATSQKTLSNALTSGKNFLIFAAVIAVLLAGVAISIASRQFSERHTNQVALMKSFGITAAKVRLLYLGQLFFLAAIASFVGLLIGHILQAQVAVQLESVYQFRLSSPQYIPYLLSYGSGLLCLFCFALPALWFLPSVPPLKILRREMVVSHTSLALQALFALFAVFVLISLFSQTLKMTLSITAALCIIVIVAAILSFLFFSGIKRAIAHLGGFWRLALSSMQRRKNYSLLQIMVFAIAIMLLLTLTIIRTSLIDEWKNQFPEKSPNHFILNIAADATDNVKNLFSQKKINSAPLYPMVRGRLIKINGVEPSDEIVQKANALQREVNLTQAAVMGIDNKLLEGEWWDKWQRQSDFGVSVEEKTAKDCGLRIGDKLQFSVGGLLLDVQVANIRSVDWKSMQPNFFFILQPGALDNYSPTYITSFYLPPQDKIVISELLHEHPTIVVMAIDRVLEQIRNITHQVGDGIGLVLWLTLASGALVLLAAVMSSIESRKQEAGLLRALGSSGRVILGSIFVEFFILGLLAGLIAIVGAEVLLISAQKFLFQMPIQPHYGYWLAAPIMSAIFISLLGVVCCRPVLTTPPMVVLREVSL